MYKERIRISPIYIGEELIIQPIRETAKEYKEWPKQHVQRINPKRIQKKGNIGTSRNENKMVKLEQLNSDKPGNKQEEQNTFEKQIEILYLIFLKFILLLFDNRWFQFLILFIYRHLWIFFYLKFFSYSILRSLIPRSFVYLLSSNVFFT